MTILPPPFFKGGIQSPPLAKGDLSFHGKACGYQ
jgi:hypothetical protein